MRQLIDTILVRVLSKYKSRAARGQAKYGTTLDRQDLTNKQWLLHLQEELMDATLYVEKLMSLSDITDASENLRVAINQELDSTLEEHLTRTNTLAVVHQRLWLRILAKPGDPSSYQYTPDEMNLLKETALSYLSGDMSGKSTTS